MSSELSPRVQSPDPRVLLAHFLHQIEARHISTPNHPPVMLHWNSKTGALVEYSWPCDRFTEERVVPSAMESLRRTHHFKGPCCLCAFLNGRDYTEARIGVVESLNSDPIRNTSVLHGEYVAVCARQRCGYFLCLERFYMIPNLKLQMCMRRARPLPPQVLTQISDVEKSFRHGDGLFQVITDVNIRGSRKLLEKLDPAAASKQLAGVFEELIRGVTEGRFYDLFAQCVVCKEVMFRKFFVTYHVCIHHKARQYHPYRHRRRPMASRLVSLPGDVPECATSSPTPSDTFEEDYDIVDTDVEASGDPNPDTLEEDTDRGDFQSEEGSTEYHTTYETEPLSLDSDVELPTVLELFGNRPSIRTMIAEPSSG